MIRHFHHLRQSFATFFVFCLAPFPLVSHSAMGAEADEVQQLLSDMSVATRTLSYKGLFTFEVGGTLETYKLIHRVEEGKEFERLLRLNGRQREIVRSGQDTDCLSPGDRLLRGLISGLGLPATLDSYQLFLRSDERVAERPVTVIQVQPVDNDRYGYILGIDKETRLPLKMILTGPDPDKRVLERIQFVALTVGDELLDDDIEAGADTATASASRVRPARRDCDDAVATLPELSGWRTEWLPRGFIFSGQRQLRNGDQMLTFTDGLATFSIFISDDPDRPPVQGRAHLGATTAYMERRVWRQVSHSVTVVGEIPLATAEKVAAGLRYNSP